MFCRGERKAAGEHGEPCEQVFAPRVEQVVAPLDRGAQRALALGRVARTTCQQRESRVEALEQELGSEEPRPRRRELDRERKPVQAAADRLDGGVRCELSPDRASSFDEESRGITRRERLEPILPLAREAQRRPAGDEHAETARGREEHC